MLSPSPDTLFQAVYVAGGGRTHLKAEDLLSEAKFAFWRWRDKTIEEWATAVYDKHGLSLVQRADKLLEMIEQRDEAYYVTACTSDIWVGDEDLALGLAHMVAVIRWISNVHAGRVLETLPATAEDAQRWLDQYGFAPVKAGQMSLFL